MERIEFKFKLQMAGDSECEKRSKYHQNTYKYGLLVGFGPLSSSFKLGGMFEHPLSNWMRYYIGAHSPGYMHSSVLTHSDDTKITKRIMSASHCRTFISQMAVKEAPIRVAAAIKEPFAYTPK